jgi:hypothetical protein
MKGSPRDGEPLGGGRWQEGPTEGWVVRGWTFLLAAFL